MLGPLPKIYRVIVSVCALAACVGLGAWIGTFLTVPVLAGTGAAVGAAIGLVAVALLLHDFPAPRPRPNRVHVRTHRHD
jgi:hypothetical protein